MARFLDETLPSFFLSIRPPKTKALTAKELTRELDSRDNCQASIFKIKIDSYPQKRILV